MHLLHMITCMCTIPCQPHHAGGEQRTYYQDRDKDHNTQCGRQHLWCSCMNQVQLYRSYVAAH